MTLVDTSIWIDQTILAGSEIGWVDAHLLCAARLARWTLWTNDGKLRAAARRVAVAYR